MRASRWHNKRQCPEHTTSRVRALRGAPLILSIMDADGAKDAPAGDGASATAPVCTFVKRRANANIRKRKIDPESDKSEDEDAGSLLEEAAKALGDARREKKNPMVQTTRKARTEQDAPSAVTVAYESTRTAKSSGIEDGGATMVNLLEAEEERKVAPIVAAAAASGGEGAGGANLYRGQAAYQEGLPSMSYLRPGPLKAPQNIRATSRFDYQPDICKDYKETGFCGYGDSCKFLHDRSDYKSGWQMEREWENEQKERAHAAFLASQESGDKSDDDGDDLPFACFICRQPFTNPIVTKCKHYFCEKCALDHHRKNAKCFVCNVNTNGVFVIAKDIIAKMKRHGAATD